MNETVNKTSDAQAVVDELDVIILGLVQAADQMSALRTERGVMTILPEAHVASLENEVSVLLQTRNFFIDICALSGNFSVGSDLTFRGEDHSYSATPVTSDITPLPHPAAQTPAS